mgnify:CR=1 FL=1
MEQVIDFSCDEDIAKHNQKMAYLKELQDIKENSIMIPKTSTAWEAAQIFINAKRTVRDTKSYITKTINAFKKNEIKAIGKHLLGHAETELELEESEKLNGNN